MAFTTAVTKCCLVGATEGLVVVFGTFTNTGGSTGGVVDPTAPDSNTSGWTLTGLTQIVGWTFSNNQTQAATENKVVKSYDATLDNDILTLTTVADEDGNFTLFCINAGGTFE